MSMYYLSFGSAVSFFGRLRAMSPSSSQERNEPFKGLCAALIRLDLRQLR